MEFVRPRFDLGQVQYVVDQGQQVLPGLMKITRIIAILDAADRPEGLVPDNLRKADDRVQGRAQLMAHRGEKLGLGPVGGSRVVARDAQVTGQTNQVRALLLQFAAGFLKIGNALLQAVLTCQQPLLGALPFGDFAFKLDAAFLHPSFKLRAPVLDRPQRSRQMLDHAIERRGQVTELVPAPSIDHVL